MNATTALRYVVLASALGLTGLFVRAVALRVTFPYELEWMCGGVLDHVARIRDGLPVYAPPTTRWIPFLYPPLFYWLGAKLGGTALACRLVSLASTAVQAVCVGRLAVRGEATRYWAAIAVLLFFGAYFYVGAWYDLERSDTLCVAIVLVASVTLLERPTLGGAIGAGLLFGLGFFAKQQALPFAAAATVALAIDRRWARAASLAAACAAVVVVGSRWQNAVTGGWFDYYVVRMPATHGVMLGLWRDVVDYDVPQGAVLLVATLGLCAWLLADAARGDRRHLLFALLLGTGALVALSSRLHVGGWINVLQPWTSFACPAVAIAASRIEARLAGSRARTAGLVAVYAAVLVQIALWVRPLARNVPDASLRADTEALLADLRRFERDGEVLVVGRGHATTPTHFQMSALADVARVEGAPADLLDALRTQRLAAIVDDARQPGDPPLGLWPPVMLEDIASARAPLFASYYVAERLDDRELRHAMPSPAEPRWVYRPRAHPLRESDPDLLRRHFAEMELAAKHAPPATIEDVAR